MWATHLKDGQPKMGPSFFPRSFLAGSQMGSLAEAHIAAHIDSNWVPCVFADWGASKTRLMPLTKLQKRAVRIITKKKYRDHINPLFLDYKLLKIAKIYKSELSKLMFKVHRNILTISDSTTFIPVSTVHHYHTRYRTENFYRK